MPWILDPYEVGHKAYQQQKLVYGAYGAYRLYKKMGMYAAYKKNLAVAEAPFRAARTAKPSLQNQVNVLKRQVGKNTPAKSHHIREFLPASVASGVWGSEIKLTSDFVVDPDYRKFVNGDKFVNHSLKINVKFEPTVIGARIIVYRPKKPGNYLAKPTSSINFVEHIDPGAFVVYHDSFVFMQDDLSTTCVMRSVNLKGLITNYNTDTSTIEEGEIVILVGYEKTGASSQALQWTSLFTISDK